MEQDFNEDEAAGVRKFRAGGTSRRVSGRRLSRGSFSDGSPAMRAVEDSPRLSGQLHKHQYYAEKLLAQVSDWLEHEKKKKKPAAGRATRVIRRKSRSPPKDQNEEPAAESTRHRSDSVDSQSSDVSFGKLQSILEDSLASLGLTSVPQFAPKHNRTKRQNSKSTLQRAYSSDTDYVDGDAIVPSCNAWLDNSKTLSYGGGAATSDEGEVLSGRAKEEHKAWLTFKNEILRIAHTLRLKGWRRIPLGSGDGIEVIRLSGALTNAVYVVTPPVDVSEVDGKKPPTKVLLRIYGPQVEHLIDRDNELKVLGRLARKKIGPRLLGTFKNGRFEQFFNAITLTPAHLREPETARQIAKRMRELHEGIELLPLERDGGPGIWRNWDAWVDNVSKIIKYLDKELETVGVPDNTNSVVHAWKANGYVCGVPWKQFRDTVDKYRLLLDKHYKSPKVIKEKLVFSHNDVSLRTLSGRF